MLDISKLFPKKWKKLKRACHKRDGYRCQFIDKNGRKCGYKKKLQVHHILRKHDHVDLIWVVLNTITLCTKHHKIVTGKEYIYASQFIKTVKQNGARR